MIRTIDDLRGPAGRLEAILNEGVDSSPCAALLCHPHPPSGGTMHTRAVYQAAKVFESLGIPVLRFNFRGVGRSEGQYDNGHGEVQDVHAALRWLAHNLALPIVAGGFSFGANVSWRAACGDPRVIGLVGLGMPLEAGGRSYSYDFLSGCHVPKLLITGAEDPFAPRVVMERLFAAAPPPTTMEWIEGAEHFFMGTPASPAPKLDRMQRSLRNWIEKNFFGEIGASTAV